MDSLFHELSEEVEYYKEDQAKWLRIWRNRYETPVFTILRERYGTALQTFWDSHTIPFESTKAFVIVERRPHPNLEFVLHNMAFFGKDWSLYLFCSQENLEFCKRLLGKHQETVHLIPIFQTIGTSEEGFHEYNQLLQTYSFWEQINAEHICMMETDCYLRKEIPDELLEYDYVGTPWGWDLNSPGGTGLTLRKRSVMLRICESCEKMEMQDSFVVKGLRELNFRWLPAKPYGVYTFVENYFTEDPVGVHQWWTFVFNRVLFNQSMTIVQNYLTLDLPK